ncbi:universal stress protein [Polyangium spumosum]|uniref:Universal stress protein n=1 Tax=Polyangium spumosum TaxID=889282 RepID=A0A6N7PK24_9BACT|nr:universal stress protein [Polyangium spumosum]MRG90454.1 universal stress protein [Polyangium spumosum]
MPLIRKILVPMDPSACSIAALEYASSFADELGASVDVLHVHEQGDVGVGSTVPLAPEAQRQAEQQMEEAISRARSRLGDRLGRSTQTGDPLKTIVHAAADGEHDLIIMGTHGRVGRLHMLVGSVAEGVMWNAPCPVLTVRVSEGEESLAERLRGGVSPADLVRERRQGA